MDGVSRKNPKLSYLLVYDSGAAKWHYRTVDGNGSQGLHFRRGCNVI